MTKNIKKIIDFFNDDTLYYSASLSFFTIFSLLPILALLVVVVSNMPIFDNYLALFTAYILDFINPTHSSMISSTIKEFLSNANQLGSIGIFYLLFVFTLFFNNYEDIVNKIFNTKKRPIYKMFFLYISFLILLPLMFILFVLASSIFQGNLYATTITFLFMWVFFIIIFKISTTAKVSFKASIFGSFTTLITLSLTKKLFAVYVLYNTTYTTIYGSFSVLLFFFLWIYISWTIYLYGIKLTALLNESE
ncbi:MAG: YihY family inner membrane protein [Arcobacteraceae bacterium]|nr:YihY family inner membrane protein [Arcobacteraceae bacterium]